MVEDLDGHLQRTLSRFTHHQEGKGSIRACCVMMMIHVLRADIGRDRIGHHSIILVHRKMNLIWILFRSKTEEIDEEFD